MLELMTPYIIFILSIGSTVMGWFLGQLWKMVQDMATKIQSLEVQIGVEYVRYDRLQDALKPIMESLNKIEIALNNKADK